MISKGKSVFRGLLFSRNGDDLRVSLYRDISKTLGINYLDMNAVVSKIKE